MWLGQPPAPATWADARPPEAGQSCLWGFLETWELVLPKGGKKILDNFWNAFQTNDYSRCHVYNHVTQSFKWQTPSKLYVPGPRRRRWSVYSNSSAHPPSANLIIIRSFLPKWHLPTANIQLTEKRALVSLRFPTEFASLLQQPKYVFLKNCQRLHGANLIFPSNANFPMPVFHNTPRGNAWVQMTWQVSFNLNTSKHV